MRTLWFATALLSAIWLAACAHQSTGPAGWQPKPGAGAAWVSGDQEYSYSTKPFSGTLQDLASQEAVNVVLRVPGARFKSSDIFPACPGHAAIATFSAPGGKLLQEAFAVNAGQALLVTYARPASAPLDAAVSSAMEHTLCTTGL